MSMSITVMLRSIRPFLKRQHEKCEVLYEVLYEVFRKHLIFFCPLLKGFLREM